MAPLTPFWAQPSYPNVQEVRVPSDPSQFTTKSFSKVNLPPFGLFAKLDFPPCTVAGPPTYATVQMGRDSHLNLNSDLVYINHACEPTLVSPSPSLTSLCLLRTLPFYQDYMSLRPTDLRHNLPRYPRRSPRPPHRRRTNLLLPLH